MRLTCRFQKLCMYAPACVGKTNVSRQCSRHRDESVASYLLPMHFLPRVHVLSTCHALQHLDASRGVEPGKERAHAKPSTHSVAAAPLDARGIILHSLGGKCNQAFKRPVLAESLPPLSPHDRHMAMMHVRSIGAMARPLQEVYRPDGRFSAEVAWGADVFRSEGRDLAVGGAEDYHCAGGGRGPWQVR